jgi:hypothetical protein
MRKIKPGVWKPTVLDSAMLGDAAIAVLFELQTPRDGRKQGTVLFINHLGLLYMGST